MTARARSACGVLDLSVGAANVPVIGPHLDAPILGGPARCGVDADPEGPEVVVVEERAQAVVLSGTGARVVVRGFEPGDTDSLYDVCLRTGDGGSDASGSLLEPRLLGEVYVGPYLALAPQLALVADDGLRAAGYALAVLDTAEFEHRCEQLWWPALQARHPVSEPPATGIDGELLAVIHHPEVGRHPVLPGFPSHLHIDLLAHIRGAGVGQVMLQMLFELLAAAGSPGVHLGVDERNTGAQRFYHRLGFVDLRTDGDGTLYQGRTLGPVG